MSVFLYDSAISYYPAAKCASSSLKRLFFEIENGFEFKTFVANGRPWHIHRFYRSVPFHQAAAIDRPNHHKIAVIRDPVDRFLSCYSHRVTRVGDLAPHRLSEKAVRAGIQPDPTLGVFIDRLADYRKHSPSIAHHTAPLVYFLGNDATYYGSLYPITALDRLVADLSARLQTPLRLAARDTRQVRLTRDALTRAQVIRIEEFYARDYETFGTRLAD